MSIPPLKRPIEPINFPKNPIDQAAQQESSHKRLKRSITDTPSSAARVNKVAWPASLIPRTFQATPPLPSLPGIPFVALRTLQMPKYSPPEESPERIASKFVRMAQSIPVTPDAITYLYAASCLERDVNEQARLTVRLCQALLLRKQADDLALILIYCENSLKIEGLSAEWQSEFKKIREEVASKVQPENPPVGLYLE